MEYFQDWESACRASKFRRAVGEITIDHGGVRRGVDLIKPMREDAYIVYRKTGIKIRQATTREVDSVRRWKIY